MKKNRDKKEQLKKDAVRYIIPHFASNKEIQKGPKIFVKGEGCYVYDIEGKKYFDSFATLLTTVCGHSRPEITKVVAEQMILLEFFPNYVDAFTVPLIKLARKLAEILPGNLEVSFFVNSGSEANETAIKIARQYFREKGETLRYKIMARRYSYSGTTLGGVSATGIPWFREYFEPLMPGFIHTFSCQCYHCELGLEPPKCNLLCLKLIEKQIEWEGPESIAAFITDPIPGSNIGFPIPPDGYLQGLRKICDKYGILLIFDEVQTGFGKTGKMFACEHWNVVPDIMTLGKGLTGGFMPLGVTVTTPEIYEVFKEAGHELRSGSTYGGHTVACAATLKNIEIIEKEKLVENAEKMGKYIKEKLKNLYKYPIVGDIRGIGLLWAIELVKNRKTKEPFEPKLAIGSFIRNFCWENGMILRNNGDILVIAPSLIIKKEEVDMMLEIIEKGIENAIKYVRLK